MTIAVNRNLSPEILFFGLFRNCLNCDSLRWSHTHFMRISTHKLRIETGRYNKIPREERLCNLCNSNKIEDETHFLLYCPRYSSIRDMFFSKIESKIPFLRLLSQETLISHLMNSTDYYINIQLISFISSCFELRDKLVL